MHWHHLLLALVNAGLWRDSLSWAVYTTLTVVLGGLRLWRKHLRSQHRIADLLDLAKPGGLTEIRHKLDGLRAALEEHNELTKHGRDE